MYVYTESYDTIPTNVMNKNKEKVSTARRAMDHAGCNKRTKRCIVTHLNTSGGDPGRNGPSRPEGKMLEPSSMGRMDVYNDIKSQHDVVL